jgi:hypothetical protein
VRRYLARIELDGVSSVIQVTRPDQDGERFPVMILGHGAGTGNRTGFDEHTAQLAAAGVACLVPDKDMTAYSVTRRDYRHMAAQYADLWRWGASQPWADSRRVGYYGESEGAWVVPWAATMTGAAFVVLVSAPVVTPRQQFAYAIGTYLTAVGAPASVVDGCSRLIGAAMPKGVFTYADFDSVSYLESLPCPVLVVYGTGDRSMPLVQGAELVIERAGGPVAVRYYGGADHGLRMGPNKAVRTDFLADLAGWVRSLSMTPQVAGAVPDQPFGAVRPPPALPVATQGYIGAAALVAVIAAGTGGQNHPTKLRLPLALARFGAVATLAAHLRYVQMLASLATSYRTDPQAVRWGHRLVRALGLVTAVSGSVAAVHLRGSRSAVAGSAAALGGVAALLSLAASLGAFGQLRWNWPRLFGQRAIRRQAKT